MELCFDHIQELVGNVTSTQDIAGDVFMLDSISDRDGRRGLPAAMPELFFSHSHNGKNRTCSGGLLRELAVILGDARVDESRIGDG